MPCAGSQSTTPHSSQRGARDSAWLRMPPAETQREEAEVEPETPPSGLSVRARVQQWTNEGRRRSTDVSTSARDPAVHPSLLTSWDRCSTDSGTDAGSLGVPSVVTPRLQALSEYGSSGSPRSPGSSPVRQLPARLLEFWERDILEPCWPANPRAVRHAPAAERVSGEAGSTVVLPAAAQPVRRLSQDRRALWERASTSVLPPSVSPASRRPQASWEAGRPESALRRSSTLPTASRTHAVQECVSPASIHPPAAQSMVQMPASAALLPPPCEEHELPPSPAAATRVPRASEGPSPAKMPGPGPPERRPLSSTLLACLGTRGSCADTSPAAKAPKASPRAQPSYLEVRASWECRSRDEAVATPPSTPAHTADAEAQDCRACPDRHRSAERYRTVLPEASAAQDLVPRQGSARVSRLLKSESFDGRRDMCGSAESMLHFFKSLGYKTGLYM